MDRPSKAVLARMPLAEAVLLLWRWVTNEERMNNLWERYRGRCYQRIISFWLMVHLIADALLKYNGSGRRAFEKALENEELETSVQAAFRKLGRLPVALSEGFLSHCTAALREAFPTWAEHPQNVIVVPASTARPTSLPDQRRRHRLLTGWPEPNRHRHPPSIPKT